MSSKKAKNLIELAPKKTTLLIQLDEDLKKQFQQVCKQQDMSCSQVIRKFMAQSVARSASFNIKNYK